MRPPKRLTGEGRMGWNTAQRKAVANFVGGLEIPKAAVLLFLRHADEWFVLLRNGVRRDAWMFIVRRRHPGSTRRHEPMLPNRGVLVW